MTFHHVVLWIDHHEARLFGLAPDHVQKSRVRNDHHHFHKDHDSLGSRRERDREFFASVCAALGESPEILLLGPGTARTDFLSHVEQHRLALIKHILASQSCADEGDEILVERGRRFFRAADRLLPAR